MAMLPRVGRAGAFSANLDVSDGTRKQSTSSESAAANKSNPAAERPSLTAAAGDRLVIRWSVTRTAHDAAKDVLVHFYLVRIDRPGQAPPPLAPDAVLLESALTMDFDTKAATSAQMTFRPEKPGAYLLRIEAQGSSGPTYAAMDLVVKS
jgi:hypothetical protein